MSGNGKERPRLATMVLGGCTGCHLALLDSHEALLDLLELVELVHSPLSGGAQPPECDILLVEGAVTSEEDAERLRDARAKAGRLVAFGTCAAFGGIGGLRNIIDLEEVLKAAYGERSPSDQLPRLSAAIRAVPDVVPVDASLPGCSPPTENILTTLSALLEGVVAEAGRRNLCSECERVHETMLHPSREFVSDAVYSVMELDEIDEDRCFLEQGVLCMGPMAREGCGARCTHANVPCRGCMGSSREDFEQGAKAIDALGAVLPAGAIMFLDDLIGTAYRFTLPVSVFPGLVGGEGPIEHAWAACEASPTAEEASEEKGGGDA